MQEMAMTVNGEGMTGLVRNLYWYEQRTEVAVKALQCLEGITQDQIDAILNGEDGLTNDEQGNLLCTGRRDQGWIRELKEHQAFREKTCIKIANRWIETELVRLYANEVKRIRRIDEKGFQVEPEKRGELADIRQTLWTKILRYAGFTKQDEIPAEFDRTMRNLVEKLTEYPNPVTEDDVRREAEGRKRPEPKPETIVYSQFEAADRETWKKAEEATRHVEYVRDFHCPKCGAEAKAKNLTAVALHWEGGTRFTLNATKLRDNYPGFWKDLRKIMTCKCGQTYWCHENWMGMELAIQNAREGLYKLDTSGVPDGLLAQYRRLEEKLRKMGHD